MSRIPFIRDPWNFADLFCDAVHSGVDAGKGQIKLN